MFLGKQELSFWGHDESKTSHNKRNFIELVQLLTEYDSVLAEHLKCSTVFQGLSKTIQNDIIESVAHVINNEIASAPFMGVQVDDTTDISCKCQLTIIVRYVIKKGEIRQTFLRFFDVSQDRTSETLTTIALRRLDKYNLAVTLVSQTYDGASCMTGHNTGVRAHVNSVCPYALFINCYAHKLNLVLSQGTRAIQDAKLFFASLDSFQNFFARLAKRTALLEEADNCGRVPSSLSYQVEL